MLEVSVATRLGDFSLKAEFASGAGVTALFGPSGAGKTSLIRMIAGLARPDAGRIAIHGETVFDADRAVDLPAHRRRVGVVMQNPLLFPHLSVRSNLTYAGWAGRRTARFALDTITALLDIRDLLERRPAALSGGEVQRVALGRALLSDPAILLLDEPLSALDEALKQEVLPFFEAVRDEFDLPIVYVSHSVDEVTRLANHLVIIEAGRTVAAGDIETVLSHTEIFGTGGLRAAGTLVTGTVRGHDDTHRLVVVDFEGRPIVLSARSFTHRPQPGEKVRLRIQPRDVALALHAPTGISIQNELACTISAIAVRADGEVDVELAVGGQKLRALITAKAMADLRLVSGMDCHALLKTVALEGRGLPRTLRVAGG